jgi:hypothetical protein
MDLLRWELSKEGKVMNEDHEWELLRGFKNYINDGELLVQVNRALDVQKYYDYLDNVLD